MCAAVRRHQYIYIYIQGVPAVDDIPGSDRYTHIVVQKNWNSKLNYYQENLRTPQGDIWDTLYIKVRICLDWTWTHTHTQTYSRILSNKSLSVCECCAHRDRSKNCLVGQLLGAARSNVQKREVRTQSVFERIYCMCVCSCVCVKVYHNLLLYKLHCMRARARDSSLGRRKSARAIASSSSASRAATRYIVNLFEMHKSMRLFARVKCVRRALYTQFALRLVFMRVCDANICVERDQNFI